ncbi:type III secretion system chaperone [Parachitinimonas caeni]|uniref:Type III secretion system chaperone n=1 Tax=Parachitinimonas caeni TaxID=3031301 RepID=A0ABT7DVN4_9NEIS|nr:type III secretion system chaperone [Parachitinimonas caeni]MDK2122712.1 type III secretion system chaperone [Parachitinimonas caeni]
MPFYELILQLGQKLGLDTSAITPDTAFIEVNYPNGTQIVLSHLAERNEIAAASALFHLPDGPQRGLVCEALLAAQAFGIDTDGCYFGVQAGAGKFIVSTTLPLDHVEEGALEKAIERVYRARQQWWERYDSGRLIADGTSEPSASPSPEVPGFGAMAFA